MKKRTRRILAALALAVPVLAGLGYYLQLQMAFTNIGQEFGAYGQYHRVLHVIEDMDEFDTLGSRVRRKLELAHIFHVEEFSVRIRDQAGDVVEIGFQKGTPEMREKNKERLRNVILEKYREALAQGEKVEGGGSPISGQRSDPSSE